MRRWRREPVDHFEQSLDKGAALVTLVGELGEDPLPPFLVLVGPPHEVLKHLHGFFVNGLGASEMALPSGDRRLLPCHRLPLFRNRLPLFRNRLFLPLPCRLDAGSRPFRARSGALGNLGAFGDHRRQFLPVHREGLCQAEAHPWYAEWRNSATR